MDGASPVPGFAFAGRLPPARRAALRAAALARSYQGVDGPELLQAMIAVEFPGRIAVASSFGTESAALLALVAEIEPTTPVIFLDTGKLFRETIAYRERLAERLGLTDLRIVRPDPRELGKPDPDGLLHRRDPDACCAVRKVAPLTRALAPFEAWVSGRKRLHGGERGAVATLEAVGDHVVASPLATWSRDQIDAVFTERGLPDHPLLHDGYASIGCAPCTKPATSGLDVRYGRWAGREKTECGIHRPALF
ncbi:MAG: phosphoadenylyl-sulfate reductase [Alphaproteobacteria bacterium]|nr:phosphoadenylyl-sulfate reductase [Alphaproteobacteria bacterium]